MTDTEKKKLVKQILRICEKQYRKGFQQGYNACRVKSVTWAQAVTFRHKGMRQNYKIVQHPENGFKEYAIDRILMELAMEDISVLYYFLSKYKK